MPVATAWFLYSAPAATAAQAAVGADVLQLVSAAALTSGSPTAWLGRLQLWALPVWSAGVLLFSIRFAFGYGHAFSLKQRGRPAGSSIEGAVARLTKVMGVRRHVRVLMSALSDSPSVVGWLRPVILLPGATLMGLTTLQLEAILAHEIGHIRRYDYLVNMVQMFIETLLFYHPAVWWTSKRIRLERELCCDDLAVHFSGNALRYARALTTLEKLRTRTPSVAMASTGGPLLYRIQRLVGAGSQEYSFSRLPLALIIALGVLFLSLNVSGLRGQDAPGVKVDLGASSVIHRSSVRYPEAAQKQGVTGTVQLEVTLDEMGNVSDARVLSGPQELRKTALESVLNWHFTKDSARSTRQVSISYSADGKQVDVQEPLPPQSPQESPFIATVSPQGLRLQAGTIRQEEFVKLEERTRLAEAAAAADEQKRAVLTTRRFLETEMSSIQNKLRELERMANVTARDQAKSDDQKTIEVRQIESARADLTASLAELKAKFESMPLPRGGDRGQAVFSERRLKGIATLGLPESVRNDLIARLPVHAGDTLTSKTVEQMAAAVREYDEHLSVQLIPTDDGQVELRIQAPNERR
jgi:TonB family protein